VDKERGKSPTKKNIELLGGKNTLATKDGVNSENLNKVIKVKEEELKKPYAERKEIGKLNIEKPKEAPKSKGWIGRSGRGRSGGYIKDSFQDKLDRKKMLPPDSPLSSNFTNDEERINLARMENENINVDINQDTEEQPNIELQKKEEIMLAMRDFKIDQPMILNDNSILKNEVEHKLIESERDIKEKERIMLAMRDFEINKPAFSNDLELEPQIELDMSEPSMDGDSDGGDGGGDGGGE